MSAPLPDRVTVNLGNGQTCELEPHRYEVDRALLEAATAYELEHPDAPAVVGRPSPPFNALHPAMVAADYIIEALGGAPHPVRVLLLALRAEWLSPTEAAWLEPLAACVAYLAGETMPEHRKVRP
jgi:hypothetical protein